MDIKILPEHYISKHFLDCNKQSDNYEFKYLHQSGFGWKADLYCNLTNRIYNVSIVEVGRNEQ